MYLGPYTAALKRCSESGDVRVQVTVWPPVWEYEHAGGNDLKSIDQRTHGEHSGIE